MLSKTSPESVNGAADKAARSAEHLAKSATRAASDALETVAAAAHEVSDDAIAPLLNRAADQLNALGQRGADAYREGSLRIRATANRASTTTRTYVRDEPVKAMLIAAASGAALMAILRLLGRSRPND